MNLPTSLVRVRVAAEAEYARLGEMTVRAYEAVPGVLDDDRDYYRGELLDVAARAETCDQLVAVDSDGALLGTVAYVPESSNPMSEWDLPNVGGFRMLAVDPPAQGRGVGRLLIEACIQRAREAGREAIVLHTLPQFVAAKRIYDALGFYRDTSFDNDLGFILLLGYRLPLT